MILVVTPNPALDVTYEVDSLRLGTANRVRAVHQRAGGKGMNVARLLHAYGVPVCAVSPVGGDTGVRLSALLDEAGVPHDLTPVQAETRRTLVASDSAAGREPTGFWEPGPVLTDMEWAAFCESVKRHLNAATVIVLSGSLPGGWPEDAYAQLIAMAHAVGIAAILDTSGVALRQGVSAGPRFTKPNAGELAALVDAPVCDAASAVAASDAARELGARDLVVSLGRSGVVAVVGPDVWRCTPPERYAGNSTGAGDAMVAALALAVRDDEPWPDRLKRMTAWSAAAAAHPVAGEIDAALAARLADTVVCERFERSAGDKSATSF